MCHRCGADTPGGAVLQAKPHYAPWGNGSLQAAGSAALLHPQALGVVHPGLLGGGQAAVEIGGGQAAVEVGAGQAAVGETLGTSRQRLVDRGWREVGVPTIPNSTDVVLSAPLVFLFVIRATELPRLPLLYGLLQARGV